MGSDHAGFVASGADDTIVFAWFDLFRVPATGGSPTPLLKVDEHGVNASSGTHPFFRPARQSCSRSEWLTPTRKTMPKSA